MHGMPLQIFAVEIREVRLQLPDERRDSAIHELFRWLKTGLPRLLERDQNRCRNEARSAAGRLLRAASEIVIPPTSVDRFVAIQQIELQLHESLNPLLPFPIIRLA